MQKFDCPNRYTKAEDWNQILVPHILKIQHFNSKMESSELKESDCIDIINSIIYLKTQEVPYNEPERPIPNSNESILLSQHIDELIFGLYNIKRNCVDLCYYFGDIASHLKDMINIDYSEYKNRLDSLEQLKNNQVVDGFTNLSNNKGLQPFFSKNKLDINTQLSKEPLDNIYILCISVFSLYMIKRLLDKHN